MTSLESRDARDQTTPIVILGLDPRIQCFCCRFTPYYTYILASRRNGTLYVGVTNDLVRRVYEHKTGVADGFSRRYNVKTLVHYEIADTAEAAIRREKTLKGWNRDWKLALIEEHNPNWRDLYETLSP